METAVNLTNGGFLSGKNLPPFLIPPKSLQKVTKATHNEELKGKRLLELNTA